MIRGTTPTHIFNLPIETEQIKEIKIIYAQNDEILLCKKREDCELDGKTVVVKLTQDETFLFDCKKPVQIEVRALLDNGVALKSPIELIDVGKCLDNEVLQ